MATGPAVSEAELTRRPLYRWEYEALGRQGAFDDEKVELLQGAIVYAAEEGPPHAEICARVNRLLIEAIPASEGEIRVGNPLAASDLSEPEPDLLVAPPTPHRYRSGHPTTASLVVEVAETSRARDLTIKAQLYAAAGVSEYWVVDLSREELVVHRESTGGAFNAVTRHRDGVVRAQHHPHVAVDLGDLFGHG